VEYKEANEAWSNSNVTRNLHYNYGLQCWVEDGKISKCGHREKMDLCYACFHAGEPVGIQEEEDFE
jgi:hypothetical protein